MLKEISEQTKVADELHQLLSYPMSITHDYDPDFPHNLSITLTVD